MAINPFRAAFFLEEGSMEIEEDCVRFALRGNEERI